MYFSFLQKFSKNIKFPWLTNFCRNVTPDVTPRELWLIIFLIFIDFSIFWFFDKFSYIFMISHIFLKIFYIFLYFFKIFHIWWHVSTSFICLYIHWILLTTTIILYIQWQHHLYIQWQWQLLTVLTTTEKNATFIYSLTMTITTKPTPCMCTVRFPWSTLLTTP